MKLDIGKNLRARPESKGRSRLLCLSDDLQVRKRPAKLVLLTMQLAVPVDKQLEMFRQGIDDRNAHAMATLVAFNAMCSTIEGTIRWVRFPYTD